MKKLLPFVLIVSALTVSTISTVQACLWTPGRWKNEEVWPVSELTLGCTTYSEMELRGILDMPTRGDATIPLAQHLIAAKLNVASGAWFPPWYINEADALLCQYPIGSKPQGDAKDSCTSVTYWLDYWNNDPKGWNPED